MLRNWSRNKMILRTRNCWERLSNTVGLYRYSQASLFLSTNVCFFTLLAGHRERSVCFHTVAKAASALLKGQKGVWQRGWYTAPKPIERMACLICHFNLSVSVSFHQSHGFRHFTKLIWPKGSLRLTSAVAFKANDLWSHDYGAKCMCLWPCVLLWVYCPIIVSHSQTFYC